MQKELIKTGYAEAVKNSVLFFNNLAETSVLTKQQIGMGIWEMKDFGDLGKTTMEFYNAMNRIAQSTLNSQLQYQLGAIDLKGSASSVKELMGICTETIKRMTESLTGMGSAYVEAGAENLEKLKGAKDLQDIAVILMHLFNEIQGNMHDEAIEMLNLMESMRVNTSAWAENTINGVAGADVPAPSVPVK